MNKTLMVILVLGVLWLIGASNAKRVETQAPTESAVRTSFMSTCDPTGGNTAICGCAYDSLNQVDGFNHVDEYVKKGIPTQKYIDLLKSTGC